MGKSWNRTQRGGGKCYNYSLYMEKRPSHVNKTPGKLFNSHLHAPPCPSTREGAAIAGALLLNIEMDIYVPT